MPVLSFPDVPDENFLRLLRAIKDVPPLPGGIVLESPPARRIGRRRGFASVRR